MSIKLTVLVALTSVTLLLTSASGQSTTTPLGSLGKSLKPGDLESEVAAVKAENAAFREALRKMEEQQKVLLDMVDRMQRKLDDLATGNAARTAQATDTSNAPTDATTPPAPPA